LSDHPWLVCADDVSGLPAVADFEPTWRDQALAGEGKWEGPRLRAAEVEEVEEEGKSALRPSARLPDTGEPIYLIKR